MFFVVVQVAEEDEELCEDEDYQEDDTAPDFDTELPEEEMAEDPETGENEVTE